MRAQRTLITVETTERFTLPHEPDAVRTACPDCGSLSGLVTPGHAATLLGLDVRGVCRAIDAGLLHVLTNAAGSLFVCFDSLKKAAAQNAAHAIAIHKPIR
ncbi:MAG: hypothetical protein WA476_00730 [Acidobacteriaceae bacterium]